MDYKEIREQLSIIKKKMEDYIKESNETFEENMLTFKGLLLNDFSDDVYEKFWIKFKYEYSLPNIENYYDNNIKKTLYAVYFICYYPISLKTESILEEEQKNKKPILLYKKKQKSFFL